MKKLLNIMLLALVLMAASCNHKDLCYNHREHAHKFHVKILADYRCDWEENYGFTDWSAFWPNNYIDYESFGRDVRFESDGAFSSYGWIERC